MSLPNTMIRNVDVPLRDSAYTIGIGKGFFSTRHCAALRPFVAGEHCAILTDSNIGPLYAAAATELLRNAGAAGVAVITFPAGEGSKTIQTVAGFYGDCVRAGLDRKSVAVALGGGVAGDMAGFLAATYMRGIGLIQMPTSLVAQVDSSIGGKTGVDLPEGKNLVGMFKQPRHVMVDLDTLQTLPKRELRAGLAEVVKYGVILDAAFFSFLESNFSGLLDLEPEVYARVVGRSCELKAEVVVADEHDISGRRAILNYGHTFGHALEAVADYSGLLHGEAVAIGMMMAADLAAVRDRSLRALVDRQQALWDALGLPTRAQGFNPADVLKAMRSDKKYERGQPRLILPTVLGSCRVVKDIPDDEILAAISGRCGP